jgi:hypothetical protein
MRFIAFLMILSITVLLTTSCQKQVVEKAVLFPIENTGIPVSDEYTVSVNDVEIFTGLAGSYSFCTFDFNSRVEVIVSCRESINQAKILPTGLNLDYSIMDAHSLKLVLDKPEMITVEINGSQAKVLHLLTSLPETDRPGEDEKNVLFYAGPGEYDVGVLELKDNQTLYIEAGAKINGMVLANGAKNVKIKGRGMIDGTYNKTDGNYPDGSEPWRLIYMTHSEDIEIDGVTLYNSPRWTIHTHSCKNLAINNVRILNWAYGSDGTDLSACQDVQITNSFYKANDDAIAIKAVSFTPGAFYPNPRIDNMDVKNILVEGCTLWNMSWGNVFEIGYELRCSSVRDITYRDCDVLMQGGRGAVFSIHNGDHAVIENVLYEDIRVENAQVGGNGKKLFDLAIFYSLFSYDSYWGNIKPNDHWDNLLEPWGAYGSSEFRGDIKNINYRNIQVLDTNFPYSIFHGFNGVHKISDISFENIHVNGFAVTGKDELKLETNAYVENLRFN